MNRKYYMKLSGCLLFFSSNETFSLQKYVFKKNLHLETYSYPVENVLVYKKKKRHFYSK